MSKWQSVKHKMMFISPVSRRICIVALCLTLLFVTGASSTAAYKVVKDQTSTITFVPGRVDCEVLLKEGGAHTYTVQNTGNASAYVRAAIILNWITEDGSIYWQSPVYVPGQNKVSDFKYFGTGENWVYAEDGYFYYTLPVPHGTLTPTMLANPQNFESQIYPPGHNSEGQLYHDPPFNPPRSDLKLRITVVAEAIQAVGESEEMPSVPAIRAAWGTDVVAAIDKDGKLTF